MSGPSTPSNLQIAQSFCVPDASTAAGLQGAFNVRGPVWGGGDGAQPVAIDGGRTLWLFGDTYIGGGPDGGALTTTGLVHNSMVVQYDHSCFLTLLGNNAGSWTSAIPEPNGTDWYWPDDGTYDPATGILSIVATHVRITTGGPFGWTELGVDVLHYQIEPTFTLVNTETLITYAPGDKAQFGQSIMSINGIVFLYGCAQSGTPACYLARTDLELDPDTLAYDTGSSWSPSLADAVPVGVTAMTGAELHVMAVDGGFLATNQVPLLGTTTNVWWSASAYGPFLSGGTLFDESKPPLGPMPSNWFTYGGRLIQTSAGTIAVYSVNTGDDEAAEVAGVYGPRFVSLDSHQLDRLPFGGQNTPTAQVGGVEIRGWSIDPDTTAPILVRLTVDGITAAQVTASVDRPDVAAYYPAYGPLHGFDTVVPLGPGVHVVCAFGLNVAGGFGDTALGCTQATALTATSRFVAVTPTRLLDSRFGTGGYTTPWAAGETRTLAVAGTAGGVVPAGATEVTLNLTVTNTTGPGFVTVAPAGGIVPTASSLNFVAGQTVANLVTVPVGVGGSLLVHVGGASANLVADVVGYDQVGAGAGFTPTTPTRTLDSRYGTGGLAGPWAAGQVRALAVAGVGPVPANATAVVLNLTGTDASAGTFVTAWAAGQPRPGTSNLNVAAGQTVANLVTVPIGAGGAIDLYNTAGTLDLVADVVGFYTATGGGPVVGLGPVRMLDTRVGTGGISSPVGPGQTVSLAVAGQSGIPANATAVVLNLTATGHTTASFVTAWAAGHPRPGTSNLNVGPGQTVANLVTVPVGAGGAIDLYNLAGHTDLIADLVSYYLPPA